MRKMVIFIIKKIVMPQQKVMNISKGTFSEAVHKKATELKITPKLLLIAIGVPLQKMRM